MRYVTLLCVDHIFTVLVEYGEGCSRLQVLHIRRAALIRSVYPNQYQWVNRAEDRGCDIP